MNQEFTLEEFQRAFPVDTITEMNEFVFCGDIGDPIYCNDLIDIVHYIKTNALWCAVHIVTNGSYKDRDWWIQLGAVLTNNDTVTFSVDGWDQASNEQYRVNSNFYSILLGMQTLREHSNCIMNWSAIYFKFNEDHLDNIKTLARDLGFDTFNAVRSTKFDGAYLVDGVDPLKPVNIPNIPSQIGIFKRDFHVMGRVPVQPSPQPIDAHPWARCLNYRKELFVNVEGLVYPCPWFNNAYLENDFVEKHRDRINVKTRPYAEILQDPLWEELVTRLEVAPLEICKLKCMK